MKHALMIAVVGASMIGTPFLTGCDKTVKEDSTMKKNADGTVTKDESKVTEKPNGDMVKTEDKTRN